MIEFLGVTMLVAAQYTDALLGQEGGKWVSWYMYI